MNHEAPAAGSIAFQGEPGAFSHLACREYAPDFTALPCPSFYDAFEAAASGRASLALLPVENLLAGRVADVHQLLHSIDLHAVGEHYQPIRFELLGVPGAKIADITTIASHVHALAQCRKLIRELNAKSFAAGDTAGSAKALAEDRDRHRGVLASSLAAELYGLDVLRSDVADQTNNFTRFVAFSKTPNPCRPTGEDAFFVTSIIAQTRNVPSALFRLLTVFVANGVNVSRLESGLLGDNFECSSFQIDFETSDPAVQPLLEECRHYTDSLRVIGTYPAADFRLSRRAK